MTEDYTKNARRLAVLRAVIEMHEKIGESVIIERDELRAQLAAIKTDLKRATEDELRFCVQGCPSRVGDKCTKFDIDIYTCGGAPYQRELERGAAPPAAEDSEQQ